MSAGREVRQRKYIRRSCVLVSHERYEMLVCQASYRAAMCVTEVMVFKTAFSGETGYYVCPRCHITLEREFMSFCDRCGQRLDWKNYKRANVIYPCAAKCSGAE